MIKLAEKLNLPKNLINELGKLNEGEISSFAEKCLENAKAGDKFQFVRTGYFCKDSKYEGRFNRIVELKDSKPAVKGK